MKNVIIYGRGLSNPQEKMVEAHHEPDLKASSVQDPFYFKNVQTYDIKCLVIV